MTPPPQSRDTGGEALGDGGPAFPYDTDERFATGMSLRDYFATHAPNCTTQDAGAVSAAYGIEMPDKLSDSEGWTLFWHRVEAAFAYAHADALLAERARPRPAQADRSET